MATPTEICNLAISHLGIGKPINNYQSDSTPEAQACKAFLTLTIQSTLKEFWWPFATRYATFGAVDMPAGADTMYTNAYRVPTDCLEIRRFVYGSQYNYRPQAGDIIRGGYNPRLHGIDQTDFTLMDDDAGTLVLTNSGTGQAEYTVKLDDTTSHLPPDFVIAVSYRLAGYIAPRITGGDPFKRGSGAIQMYAVEIANARTNAARQGPVTQPAMAPWITGRDQ